METKIDPKAFYRCAVPHNIGAPAYREPGRNFRRGERCLGSDPAVMANPELFVLEDEATDAALNEAYSRHWNKQTDPESQGEKRKAAIAARIAEGMKPRAGDDLVTASAKRIVSANPDSMELAWDGKGQCQGARFKPGKGQALVPERYRKSGEG